jgi:long-subunit acyl-CoA synthetase (AMP-forming)
MLDHVLAHAEQHPDRIYLTQPVGGGQVVNYTWAQVLDQSLRMAAHLQSRGLAPGARVAMLSKNCAHFIMAELAIWMAGCTTVAIFPTETADTVRYVLEHSGASLLFVGKLDTWAQQRPGVPSHPALHRAAAGTADRVRNLGRHRGAHAAAGRPAQPCARRSGDAAVHLGLHRHAQGGDDGLQRADTSRRRHPRRHSRSASARRQRTA